MRRSAEGQNNSIMDVRLPSMIARVCLATSAALWKRSWTTSYPSKDGRGSEGSNVATMSVAAAEDEDLSGVADFEKEVHLLQMLASHPVWMTAMTVIKNNGYYEHVTQQNLETLFEFCHETVMHSLKFIMAGNDNTVITQQQQSQQQRVILHMAVMTCVFLSSLVGEFGGSNSAITYNCPLEFHRTSHVIFEQEGISKVLNIAMGGLSGIVNHWNNNSNNNVAMMDASVELAVGVVDVIVDVLGWEFGSIGGGHWGRTGGSGLVRPPESWREYLIRPDLLGAVFYVYTSVRELGKNHEQGQDTITALRRFQHSLRQLLIGLASITGSIFQSKTEKGAYLEYFVNGLLSVLSMIVTDLSPFTVQNERSTAEDILLEQLQRETVDFCCMMTRIVTNFRVEALSILQNFATFLSAIASVGDVLLRISVSELKAAHGDVEVMADDGDWRNEAIGQLLEAVCLLSEDHWLLSSRAGNAQDTARNALASSLAPLYSSYVSCRIEMAKMEEFYLTANAAELDEVREEISGVSMDEEMNAASSLGRVHLPSSLSCLSSVFQSCVPKLQALFASDEQAVTPDAAALLEEARLLILCTGHLLTDDCAGETPFIPEAILNSCVEPSDLSHAIKTGSDEFAATTHAISQIVHVLMGIAEFQVSKVALSPKNPNLSPLLAKTLLWFFTRWASAYILPSSSSSSISESGSGQKGILDTWSNQETSRQVVSFCVTLCLHYFTLWPHESQVIQGSSELLFSLAKRDRNVKLLLMSCPSMEHLFNLHICTAGQIHSSTEKNAGPGVSEKMASAFRRIPYKYRANILTAILTSSSEINDAKSESCFNACLQAVQDSFRILVEALEQKKVRPHDVFTVEMTCLCVELFGGITRASEICHPERIPIFMTPFLPQLAALMNFYATDITICELLLVLFRDYTERYIVSLDREQCMTVFRASADLLKDYSSNHCQSRVIRKAVNDSQENDVQEEQSYNDVLCAIQLLNNIGAKDFVDSFSSQRTGAKGVDSNEVIEVVFFGLKQILPLMTNGLLHFPTLCKQYFSLLGFMMETYPDKIGMLPFDLFNGLLNSMLFGMSHTDLFVSKSSLQGIAALCREQIENKSLSGHLSQNPSLFDECSKRILEEVIFQSIIWDRIEPAANALLPLAAVDMNKFATVVNMISQQLDTEKKQKIQQAFQTLMDPDVIGKVSKGIMVGG
jgi:hypothetical protein